ncbi:hypothetical protein [Hyphomonas sp. KY3]|uniref:hypothetical protein n=1 Tax=Hyphomonas sp. KY3 TaxID=2016196 RepID=UPI001A8FA647|nr:hypothetical protein [Hyphomonas sp. KY3]QSR23085.1 hypothetical protein CFA77_12360 [Hyphomonas sp. KY3]
MRILERIKVTAQKAHLAGLVLIAIMPGVAKAQEDAVQLGSVAPSFEMSSVDENGVDVLSGSIRHTIAAVSIGNSSSGMTYSVVIPSLAHAGGGGGVGSGLEPIFHFNNYSGGVGGIGGIGGSDQPDCNAYFELAGARTYFCGSLTDGYTPKGLGGDTFTYSNGLFTFKNSAGVEYISKTGLASRVSETDQFGLQEIHYPSGESVTIHRSVGLVTYESSRGYSIREQTVDGWETSTVTAFNRAVDYCEADATSCSFSQAWPTAVIYRGPTQTSSVAYVQDMAGQVAKYYARDMTNNYSGYHYYKVKPVGAEETATITYEFCAPWYVSCPMVSCPLNQPQCVSGKMAEGKVRKATKAGKEWLYDYYYSTY